MDEDEVQADCVRSKKQTGVMGKLHVPGGCITEHESGKNTVSSRSNAPLLLKIFTVDEAYEAYERTDTVTYRSKIPERIDLLRSLGL